MAPLSGPVCDNRCLSRAARRVKSSPGQPPRRIRRAPSRRDCVRSGASCLRRKRRAARSPRRSASPPRSTAAARSPHALPSVPKPARTTRAQRSGVHESGGTPALPWRGTCRGGRAPLAKRPGRNPSAASATLGASDVCVVRGRDRISVKIVKEGPGAESEHGTVATILPRRSCGHLRST